ncbi:MAG: serine hydrolase domain-containing protein [Bacteroidota bacterium]
MPKLKFFGVLIAALLCWTVFIGFGLVNGFLLRPLTSDDTPEGFIAAADDLVQDAFVGNMALVLLDDAEVVGQYFHSVDAPVADTTAFQVASISKWVTAWGVFALVERGDLDLDTPVSTYLTRWQLPESDYDNDAVIIRRLLSHTAGLVDGLGYAGFPPGEPVQTIEASLTQASDAPWSEGQARVGLEPGTEFMYSGASYTLLQLLIEEVSGQSFQDFMTEAVFEPLQMHRSTFVWPDSAGWDLAPVYTDDGSTVPYDNFTALAAAGLYTTVADLARFVRANVEPNPVLAPETVALMYTPEAFMGTTGIHALGPSIYARDGDGVFIHGHDGSGNSINTAARVNLDTGEGIIVFETGHPYLASHIADHWGFWTTGLADYVVIQANKTWMLSLLIGGYALIVIGGVVFWRRHRNG